MRHFLLSKQDCHCNFKVSCLCTRSTDVDYTDHMVLHQLLVGLADSEIQEDLLAIDKLPDRPTG